MAKTTGQFMAAKDQKKPKKTKRPTALKRDIRNAKRRDINRQFKSKMRTTLRTFETSLTSSDSAKVQEDLKAVYSVLDKGVKRGLIKLNTAARTKARFCARAAAVNAA